MCTHADALWPQEHMKIGRQTYDGLICSDTRSHADLQFAEGRKMEAHSLAGWVGWSAGHSGAVHLGILQKRFTHTRKYTRFYFTIFITL